MPDKSILDKIRKLQVLSERAGNEHEAQIASLRLRELLQKHNLEIGAIQMAVESPKGTTKQASPKSKTIPDHWPILAHCCNELYDVQHFAQGGGRKYWRYHFLGLPSNVEAACEGFRYLVEAIEDLWADRGPDMGFPYKLLATTIRGIVTDARAFRNGASQRIYDGILKAKEAEKQTKATMELVLVGNAIAKQMFDGLQFEKTDMRETAPKTGTEASYLHGYIRGSAVNPKGMKRKEIR